MIKKIINFIIDSWLTYCTMVLMAVSAYFLIEKTFIALLVLAIIATGVTRIIGRRRKHNAKV